MAVYITHPEREEQRRFDGVFAVIVEAANAAAVPAEARTLFPRCPATDFNGWAVLKLSDEASAGFRPVIVDRWPLRVV